MTRFKNACVVVTGAASGIGEATARGIVREGGNVVIADLQVERGQALAEELGENAIFHKTDVTREADIAGAIETAQTQFGPLTGMVNNAGIVGAIGSIMDTSADAYDHTMSILARAVFLGIKHAAKAMVPQRRGAIVSLSSTAGIVGGLGSHAYTMAKHGVVGLTKSAACELSSHGIRVNAVAPGNTVTDMTSSVVANDPSAHDTTNKAFAATSPLGFAGLPDDIANGILFLLSEDARFASGHTLVIDAGQTTGSGGAANPLIGGNSEMLLHAGQRKADT